VNLLSSAAPTPILGELFQISRSYATAFSPGIFGFLSAQKLTFKNSRCATFTNMADGYSQASISSRSCICYFIISRYVPAKAGVGLVLKTKSAALLDGDRIFGVVKATDTRHDGRSQGSVAPNVKGQIAIQISRLEKASFLLSQIECVHIPEYFNIFLILPISLMMMEVVH